MRSEPESPDRDRPPTLGKLGRETVELGRMATSWWFGGLERAVAGSLALPARAAASTFGDIGAAVEARLGSTLPRPDPAAGGRRGEPPPLRKLGAELLRRSADVHEVEDPHPAYRRILEELAPDEARILRLLADYGRQPVVDVRSGLPPGRHLVEPDLTLVGLDAGCRYADRTRAYLENLRRLGLASVTAEPVGDPMRYQLLEAQPEVVTALREGGRTARTDRRSVGLTSFGLDFSRACLPLSSPAGPSEAHPPAPAGG